MSRCCLLWALQSRGLPGPLQLPDRSLHVATAGLWHGLTPSCLSAGSRLALRRVWKRDAASGLGNFTGASPSRRAGSGLAWLPLPSSVLRPWQSPASFAPHLHGQQHLDADAMRLGWPRQLPPPCAAPEPSGKAISCVLAAESLVARASGLEAGCSWRGAVGRAAGWACPQIPVACYTRVSVLSFLRP